MVDVMTKYEPIGKIRDGTLSRYSKKFEEDVLALFIDKTSGGNTNDSQCKEIAQELNVPVRRVNNVIFGIRIEQHYMNEL